MKCVKYFDIKPFYFLKQIVFNSLSSYFQKLISKDSNDIEEIVHIMWEKNLKEQLVTRVVDYLY